MTTRQTMILPWMCALALAGLGCTDDVGSEAEGTNTDTDSGDGDGDPGDGDGDPTGDGPFQLFNAPGPDRTPIHRCFSGADHFLSPDPGCEGRAFEGLLGYAATTRTSSAPRALSRCFHAPASAHFHWLADRCPTEKPGVAHESVLGYVR